MNDIFKDTTIDPPQTKGGSRYLVKYGHGLVRVLWWEPNNCYDTVRYKFPWHDYSKPSRPSDDSGATFNSYPDEGTFWMELPDGLSRT